MSLGRFRFLYHVPDMKTLLNPRNQEEIIARLQAVRPTSPRLWGNMTAHQMVCHLSDGFRMYMGLKPVRPVPVPYPRTLLKWAALWAPIPWPKGFTTAPELDQQIAGTPPVEFDNDVNELRSLVNRFTRQPKDCSMILALFNPHDGESIVSGVVLFLVEECRVTEVMPGHPPRAGGGTRDTPALLIPGARPRS